MRCLALLLLAACAGATGGPARGLSPLRLISPAYTFTHPRALEPTPEMQQWFSDFLACYEFRDDPALTLWYTARRMYRWDMPLLGYHTYYMRRMYRWDMPLLGYHTYYMGEGEERLQSLIVVRADLLQPGQERLRSTVLHELVHRFLPFAQHGSKWFHACGVSG
jgi:hypothetical protein